MTTLLIEYIWAHNTNEKIYFQNPFGQSVDEE